MVNLRPSEGSDLRPAPGAVRGAPSGTSRCIWRRSGCPVDEVAPHKARQAYVALGRPVIIEEGGLFINGFPGRPLATPATSMLGLAEIRRFVDMTASRAEHFTSVRCTSWDG